MKHYHHPVSSNARKAVIVAKHLGTPVELEFLDLAKGANRAPEFLKLNPNHKVPTLVDGDLALWESHAIMIYLAEKTPGQTVYPSTPEGRADVHRWMFWCSNHWSPAVGSLTWENVLKPMMNLGAPDAARIAENEGILRELGGILDAHLATRDFVCGANLTVADFAIACPLMFMAQAKLPLGELANLQRWFGKIQELPAWKATNPQF